MAITIVGGRVPHLETCWKCNWFAPTDVTKNVTGQCRRNPPIIDGSISQDPTIDDATQHFCGEWRLTIYPLPDPPVIPPV